MGDESRRDGTQSTTLNRRRLLQTVGAGVASLTALSGLASAHQSQFFGCSQVCTDTEGDYAVVFHRGEYECRPITRTSDRNNLPWDWTAYCYEADWDEAIVGMIEENVLVGNEIVDDGTCTLCLNPNRCAQNYYDDPGDIVDALNEDGTCAPCLGSVELGTDCDVSGSSGRNHDRGQPEEESASQDPHREHDWEPDEDGDKRGRGPGKGGNGRSRGERNGEGRERGDGNGRGKAKGRGRTKATEKGRGRQKDRERGR